MMKHVSVVRASKVCDWVNAHPEYYVVAITFNSNLTQYEIFYEDINTRQTAVPVGVPIVVPPMHDWKTPPVTCDASKDRSTSTGVPICESL